jgi:translocation and assembly module TamA
MLATGLLAACASDVLDSPEDTSALGGTQPVVYSASIEGLEQLPEIQEIARASARIFLLQPKGAPSRAGLERRAGQDIETVSRVLRAEGHYDVSVVPRLTDGGASGLNVALVVTPGPQYRFGDRAFVLDRQESEAPAANDLLSASGLIARSPARGEAVLNAEATVLAFLKRQGFPDASFKDRKAVAVQTDSILNLTSTFSPGLFTRFGELEIDPQSSLDAEYIRALVPWKEGAVWDQKKVENFQDTLKSTGLFASVSLKPVAQAEGGRRDLVLSVDNSKQRSIGGSLRYDTDQGPGVRVFWRHRNLLGRAEDFRAEADVSLNEQKLTLGITRPRHPSAKWTSNESLTLKRLDEDAFEEESATFRSGMEINAGSGWVLGGRLEGSASQVRTDFENDTSYLIGLPLFARRDRTDDPLDATSGYRLLLGAGPFAGLSNGEFIQFGVVGGGGSVYLPLIGKNRLVLALRSRVTSILSQDLDDIPVNQRLFAGGGASVRGFEFQSISPTNAQNDLTGGRFLNENSVELRLRLGESFGLVGFADAGLVEEEPFPSFEERMNIGVGGGFRYYSPVGPIRFDVAFPLDRRGGDNIFEFYISLGQAF